MPLLITVIIRFLNVSLNSVTSGDTADLWCRAPDIQINPLTFEANF